MRRRVLRMREPRPLEEMLAEVRRGILRCHEESLFIWVWEDDGGAVEEDRGANARDQQESSGGGEVAYA